jgi:hypothetical protein
MVILVDLGDDEHEVVVSNAGWRATVDVFRPFSVVEGERLHRLETAWLGEQITQEEAQAIGNDLISGPLFAINWISNVYPPPGYWTDALGGKLRDYDQDTYWPSWLRAFAGFCLTCKGFVVY